MTTLPQYGERLPQNDTGTPSDPTGIVPPTENVPPSPEVVAEQRKLPPEDLVRGMFYALAVLPLGIVAWGLLWQINVIASIVSFGVAWGAVRLYRLGSGGRLTARAVPWLLGLIVVTVVLAFFAGIALDIAAYLQLSPLAAASNPEFWDTYWLNVFQNGDLWSGYTADIVFTLLFTVLGCFSIVRQLVLVRRAAAKP